MPTPAAPPPPPAPAPAEPKPTPPPSAALRLAFNPSAVEVKPGVNFTVALQVENGTDLFSTPLKIKFDPKLVRVVEVKAGSMLSGDGQKLVFSENTLNDVGETSVLLNRVPGAGGVSGSGPLVNFTFQALAAGTSKIMVSEATLRTSTLQQMATSLPELTVNSK